ncbi:MAG: thioesterase family protein [Chitinophagaceae bacterium]
MEKPASKVFEYRITATADDIDALGHVNNIVYLRWVQEAAVAHWTALSNAAINEKYSWVVMRHEIDYLQPALLNDQILAYTWVGKNAGARSERHTQLCNAVTGKKLAEAVTTWCLLDAATMRPKRIEAAILSLFEQDVQ